jgi:membrane protease YdiL (CAAX protease family)
MVTAVQLALSPLIRDELAMNEGELTPWIAVFGVVTLQLPLFFTFFAARRFFPNQYTTRLNTQDYSLGAAIKEAVKQFLMFWPLIYILSVVWGAFLFLLHYLNLIGEFAPQEIIEVLKDNQNPLAIGLLVLSAAIIAPIVEEVIFRGFLYRFFKSKLPLLSAQALSGLIFALIHANLLSFIPLAFLGFLLARSYEKSGNILVPICFHTCFNSFTLTVLFIEVST